MAKIIHSLDNSRGETFHYGRNVRPAGGVIGSLRLVGVDDRISEGLKLRLGEVLAGDAKPIGLFRVKGTWRKG